MSEREELLGSGVTTVIKIGNTVHRTSGKWTESVHALLNHIRTHGFSAAPVVLGFDKEGREILSYIEGEVYHDPILYSENALISAAKLLRAYHDATLDFVTFYNGFWQFEPRYPIEVLCHADYASYNCVIKNDEVVGFPVQESPNLPNLGIRFSSNGLFLGLRYQKPAQ